MKQTTKGRIPSAGIVPTDEEAARFLLQAQFSASDTEIASVRAIGYSAWLDEQMALPLAQNACDWMDDRGYSEINDKKYFDTTVVGEYAIWRSLFVSPDAVRKRMALAISEIFVVSYNGLMFPWDSYAVAHYWDTLNKDALGNFRSLLEDVTLNPAMGMYLNMQGNQKEDPATGRLPDENYAREIMQLFTVGLHKLETDGTAKTDASGNRIETYTQSDVSNLARVFTGWWLDRRGDILTPGPGSRLIGQSIVLRRPMRFVSKSHSTLEASFLGVTIPAGTDGVAALRFALDTLFHHPNVGPFFGKQLIQRLVTSDPSPEYVGRVSAAFDNNGNGVRGDLKAVLRAVLLDTDARGAVGLTQPGWGKVREPMLRLLQWGRSFGATSEAGSWKLGDQSAATQLGQSPLRSPSVFNFFRPGYVPPGTSMAVTKTPAPEFQIVNETTVAAYINFMQDVIRKGIKTNSPNVPYPDYTTSSRDIKAAYLAELAIVTDATALVARLNLILCAGQLSSTTRSSIVAALNANPVTSASHAAVKLNRVASAVLLTVACTEYLIQK